MLQEAAHELFALAPWDDLDDPGHSDLKGTVIALPEVPTKEFSATGEDVGDGAAMRWQHGRAMGRQVAVRKTAEDVGDLDHDRRQRPVISSSRMPVSEVRVGSIKWV
jgi:hypothetical protein